MIYIQERADSIQDTIIDENGKTWEYQYTVIKTEYIKREANDTTDRYHFTRKMTEKNEYNSVPEVAGYYYKDENNDTNNPNNSDSLDFYVYNVYRPAKTSVVVHKAWEQNGKPYSPEAGTTADIYLGRYKLTPKADYTSADNETKARVMIYQTNYDPKNAVWFENNRDLRPGDRLEITFRYQYHEVVKYSINEGPEQPLPVYTDATKPDNWVDHTIEVDIPANGILEIALDDEWSGVAGKITVKRDNDVIASINDGNVPDSPYENPDMVYTIDKGNSDAPMEFGPVKLSSSNGWAGIVSDLDPYDENGNQYRYFILREKCDGEEGTILVVGTTEKGEVLTSDGMEEDPILTATNHVPATTITIKKTDKNSYPLPGAVFRLSMNKNGSWVTIQENIAVAVPEGGTDATASVPDLFDGRYKLTEVHAPAGYIILNQEIYFNIQNGIVSLRKETGATADAEVYNNMVAVGDGTMFTVQNEPGARLPSTGGVGTTLYYVLGSLLTLAAAVLLVAKRRMRA